MPNPSGTKRLVFRRPDGRVAIDIPIKSIADSPAKLEAHRQRMLADNSTWVHESTVEMDTLPSSRRFRNSWRMAGGVVAVDMPLAREDVEAQARKDRDKRLLATDGPMQRATEQQGNSEQVAWKAHRQDLRDLPTTVQTEVEAIMDPATLEAYTPTWPIEPA